MKTTLAILGGGFLFFGAFLFIYTRGQAAYLGGFLLIVAMIALVGVGLINERPPIQYSQYNQWQQPEPYHRLPRRRKHIQLDYIPEDYDSDDEYEDSQETRKLPVVKRTPLRFRRR